MYCLCCCARAPPATRERGTAPSSLPRPPACLPLAGYRTTAAPQLEGLRTLLTGLVGLEADVHAHTAALDGLAAPGAYAPALGQHTDFRQRLADAMQDHLRRNP